MYKQNSFYCVSFYRSSQMLCFFINWGQDPPPAKRLLLALLCLVVWDWTQCLRGIRAWQVSSPYLFINYLWWLFLKDFLFLHSHTCSSRVRVFNFIGGSALVSPERDSWDENSDTCTVDPWVHLYVYYSQ